MSKRLLALLALVLVVVSCKSHAPPPAPEEHRVGSFNPTCTATGVPRVLSGVQQGACSLGSANQVLTTNAGATDVTWTTPAGGSTPTGTGFSHVTAGALDAASKKVDLTAAADVTVPATANGVVTSSGTVLQQASNVLAGANYVSIGATPATAGAIQLPSATTAMMARNAANTANIAIADFSAADSLYLGCPSSLAAGSTTNKTWIYANNGVLMGNAGATMFSLINGQVAIAAPVVGDGTNGSSPWAGMNGMFVKNLVGASYTMAAIEYGNSIIKVTGSGANTIQSRAVTDAGAVMKFFWNGGSGTLAVQDSNAVACGTLAAGMSAWFLFVTSNCKQMTAAF